MDLLKYQLMILRKLYVIGIALLFVWNNSVGQSFNYLDTLDVALAKSKNISDSIRVIQTIHEEVYKYDKHSALELLYKGKSLLKGVADDQLMADNLFYLGKFWWQFSSYDSANYYFDRSLVFYKKLNHPSKEASVLDIIALIYFYQAQYDSAIILLDKAYSKINNLKDQGELTGRIFHHKGLILMEQGKYTPSLEAFSEALKYLKTLNIPGVVSDSQIKINRIVDGKLNYTQSEILRKFTETEEERKKDNPLNNIRAILELIELYSVTDSASKVMDLGKEYLEIAEREKHLFLLGHANFVMGTIMFEKEDYSNAAPFFQKAYSDFLIEKETPINIAVAAYKLSDSYLNLNQYDSALKYVQISLSINERLHHVSALLRNQLLLCNIIFNKGEMKEAILKSENALELAFKNSNHRMIPEFYKQLSFFYNQINKPELEYRYKLKYLNYQDSIYKFGNILEEIRLKTEYGLFLAEHEISTLNQKSKSKELELTEAAQLRNRILLLTAFILFGALMLFVRYRHFRQLERKKSLLLKETHHRLKNNLQMVVSILNMSDHYDTNLIMETKARILTISTLHSSIYQDTSSKTINLKEYLMAILINIRTLYNLPEENTDTALIDIDINTEKALLLGLVFNELVSNSIKHCRSKVDSKEYLLKVNTLLLKGSRLEMAVNDNGKGWNIENSKEISGTGLVLVEQLVNSLKGTFRYPNKSGSEFVVVVSV